MHAVSSGTKSPSTLTCYEIDIVSKMPFFLSLVDHNYPNRMVEDGQALPPSFVLVEDLTPPTGDESQTLSSFFVNPFPEIVVCSSDDVATIFDRPSPTKNHHNTGKLRKPSRLPCYRASPTLRASQCSVSSSL